LNNLQSNILIFSKRNLDVLISLGLFFGFFFVYAHHACPSVYPDDSGETITAAYSLGIAHPPGYPLFSLLGKFFTLLPVGAVAYRVNLCSSFLGGLAVTLAFSFYRLTCRQFSKGKDAERIGAFMGALSLGLCPIFWHQALVAKGGIYLLNICLILTCLILLMRWSANQENRYLNFFFLIFGLGLANHHMSIMMFAPGLFLFAYFHRRNIHFTSRQAFGWAMGLAVGFSVYPIYLLTRTAYHPKINWMVEPTLSGLWLMFSRHAYGNLSPAAKNLPQWLIEIVWAIKGIFDQFIFPMVSLAFFGLYILFKRNRQIALVHILFFIAVWAGILSAFPFIPEVKRFLGVFSIPNWMLVCAWISVGGMEFFSILHKRSKVLGRAGIVLLFTFVVIQGDKRCLAEPSCRLKKYFFAEDYCLNLLRSVRPHSFLFVKGDASIFPMWYLQKVEGVRPDVIVLDPDLLVDWIGDELIREHPDVLHSVNLTSQRAILQDLITMNYPAYSMYFSYAPNEADDLPGFHSQAQSLVYKIEKAPFIELHPGKKILELPAEWTYWKGRSGAEYNASVDAYTLEYVQSKYLIAAVAWGSIQAGLENFSIAEKAFRYGISFDPLSDTAHFNLAFVLQKQGRRDEALVEYGECLKLNPGLIPAYQNRAVLYRELGREDLVQADFVAAQAIARKNGQ
jgi:tetratricopeptide (TPR) repeat protein